MRSIYVGLLLVAASQGQTGTPAVSASPTSLTFSYQIGAAKLPAAQAVSVKSASGTPAYTVTVSGANSQWLTVTPDTGRLPASLSGQVNPTSLAAGQYAATITITVTGVATPLTVPVTLNVTSPPPTLTLSATTLSFTAPPSPPATQAIQLSTTGSPISFTAAAGSPWLSVSPPVGVIAPGAQILLTVSVDPSSLAPQAAAFSGKITITQVASGAGAAKSQTVTVNLTVNASTPTITSVWPATLPVNGGAQTITIRGSNFYKATGVTIQGFATALTTTVLSADAMLAVVPASDLGAPATLKVIATNPAPGGASAPASVSVANIPVIQAICNVASYATASVSPGELVTIFGSNIGPATPAGMTIVNGLVQTSLGGVTVTVDNQPAPLLYVSQNQVTLQVPYEVTQGNNKVVSLVSGTSPAATATVNITPTMPGIFTADGSGAGQAAALNFNASTGYTLNASASPVKLGDMIILYVTGEGDYNPALTPRTGLIVPGTMNPLPQVNPLPVVTIGGAAATVSYAGPLVGSILGLLQINATVPAGATTGQAVPVVVNVGGVAGQSSTTISVHP